MIWGVSTRTACDLADIYVSGVKEELDGDSEEADDTYGQSWRNKLQGWTVGQNCWNMFTVQLPVCYKLWMVSDNVNIVSNIVQASLFYQHIHVPFITLKFQVKKTVKKWKKNMHIKLEIKILWLSCASFILYLWLKISCYSSSLVLMGYIIFQVCEYTGGADTYGGHQTWSTHCISDVRCSNQGPGYTLIFSCTNGMKVPITNSVWYYYFMGNSMLKMTFL